MSLLKSPRNNMLFDSLDDSGYRRLRTVRLVFIQPLSGQVFESIAVGLGKLRRLASFSGGSHAFSQLIPGVGSPHGESVRRLPD